MSLDLPRLCPALYGARVCGTGFVPVCGKAVKENLVVRAARARLSEDDDVEASKMRLVMAEGFPHEALQAISAGRPTTMFLGYCKSEPGIVFSVFPGQDREKIVPAPACPGEYPFEGGGIRKALQPVRSMLNPGTG